MGMDLKMTKKEFFGKFATAGRRVVKPELLVSFSYVDTFSNATSYLASFPSLATIN